jgi:DNA-directed RNA polymerase subunit RPC12/RpoP
MTLSKAIEIVEKTAVSLPWEQFEAVKIVLEAAKVANKIKIEMEFGASYICVSCGKTIGPFRDELSEKEFSISGFCQECQDKVFE